MVKKYTEEDRVTEKDMKNILRELKGSLKELMGDNLVKMILYGSRARGDYDNESDTDIAIIVRELSRQLKNRILDIVADAEIKYLSTISILIFTEENFSFLKKRERRIVMDIEKDGIPL